MLEPRKLLRAWDDVLLDVPDPLIDASWLALKSCDSCVQRSPSLADPGRRRTYFPTGTATSGPRSFHVRFPHDPAEGLQGDVPDEIAARARAELSLALRRRRRRDDPTARSASATT